MSATITVTLPDDLKNQLEQMTRQEGTSVDVLMEKAIRDYLFSRRLEHLRERMVPQAEAQGIHTDEDVFDRVS